VLPIESTLAGPIAETHDLLQTAPLAIGGEIVLRVRHQLLGVERVPLERIRVVRSHPAALDQCRRLLAGMPWATAIAAGSTAEAAAEVAERGDPTEAAIAGERAAAVYGLTAIDEDVGDHAETYTRFVWVATHTRLDSAGQDWRTAFSFVTDHRPGALHHAIGAFAVHGIDLVQLVSRPIPDTPWRYCFHAVLAGHPLDPPIRAALAETQARTRRLKVFGSYPARGEDV
jgi:prephenate dehydratase